jgi:hypothetical protein
VGDDGKHEYRAPVRRLGIVAMVLGMAVAAAACGDDGEGDGEAGGATATTAGATTAPVQSTAPATTVAATSLTLRITDLRLVNSEESDNGMRVLLPAGVPNASVTLTGLPSPNRVISVCQARELDGRANASTCRTPASGEAVNVALGSAASGVEIVQLGVSSGGPEGNATALEEVTIRYSASSREVNMRLPSMAAGETGGRPTFTLTPPSTDGAYRASLNWTVIPVFGGSAGTGQVELVQGGNVINPSQSSAAVRLNGNVPAPVGEVAIRVQNVGGAAMLTPKLTLLLP